ncbi:MAG: exosortase H [Lysobacterales bacterium]
MTRFLILFLVLLGGLFSAQIMQSVQDAVILPFTAVVADVSVAIVRTFDSDVAASGKIIRSLSNNFAVSIEPGCNGVEALIVLFSAIFAFPAPLKHKLAGFAVGFFAIQGLNLVRIISLFYLGQWNLDAFNFFHLYLWQALIILDALVVWLVWLRYLPPQDPESPADPGDPPAAVAAAG